jgi:hypothetical protein
MNPSVFPAARLPERERKHLAIPALSGSATISDLAMLHGVSRKFVYQQTHKASVALDAVFASTPAGANALLHIRVADLNGELADIFKKPPYGKRSKFTQKNLWEDFPMAA